MTGLVHPDRIWRNAGAQVGDMLVLTKALGTGIVANALRKDAVDDEVLAAAVTSMTTLNRAAADALRDLDPHAVTDVTGFGLLGHLREMCEASGVHARVSSADLPLLPGVERMARAGLVPGGSQRNRSAADAYWTWGRMSIRCARCWPAMRRPRAACSRPCPASKGPSAG